MWRSAARSIGACLALLCFFAVSSADPSPPSRADVTSGVRVAQRLIDTIPSPWRLDGDVRMAGDDAPVAQGNFVQASYALNKASLDSIATFSRVGNAMQFDSSGYLTYGPNNLLLNTATLGTQSVTVVVGVNYILSIKGTGSVTLTGASTAGPLNGTGASNRVDLKITAATTSLTLTVSGSVTSARLSAVTYETAFRLCDDVDTTAAAYYGPRFDYTYNGSSWVPAGLLVEGAATNLYLNSSNLSAANTATAGVAKSTDGTLGPDNSSAMVKMTPSFGAGAHEFYQGITVTGGVTYTASYFVKKGNHRYVWVAHETSSGLTGVLAVFDLDNPSAATQSFATGTSTLVTSGIINEGGGIYRIYVTGSSVAGGTGYLLGGFIGAATGNPTTTTEPNYSAAGTETMYAWGAQFEAGNLSSYTPTGASAVTRAAETVQLTGTALSTLQGASASLFIEYKTPTTSAAHAYAVSAAGGAAIDNWSSTQYNLANGSTNIFATVSSITNTINRLGVAYSGSGRSFVGNGGTVSTDANAANFTGAMYLGSNAAAANSIYGYIRSFAAYNSRLPDATLQQKSVVGASYAANDNGIRYAFADNDNLPVHWRVAL